MGGEAITPTAYIHKLTKSTHLAYYIRGRITDVLLHRDLCPPICQGSELINKFVDTLLKHGNQGLQVAAWKKKKKKHNQPSSHCYGGVPYPLLKAGSYIFLRGFHVS